MNLIYTNYIINHEDLETEIEFLIENELNHYNYKHMSLEIIFYIKKDEPKTMFVNSFPRPSEHLIFKCFSVLDFFFKFI